MFMHKMSEFQNSMKCAAVRCAVASIKNQHKQSLVLSEGAIFQYTLLLSDV